jgi:peptidoglycan/LPS O-acetylase OafA/YrhL
MGGSGQLVYQPALDGVRALAVLAVLFFHAGTPGFGGGYLGVSVFFTLSGYLITSLLLDEHERTGTIDTRKFYGRRLRRLLPASIATVATVVVLGAVTDVFDAVAGLRAQVIGALSQVSNWVLLTGNTSYQDLLAQASGTASPLEHFWSLAIEEQFYWLWPPLMMLMLSRLATARSRTIVVGVMTAGSMVAAPVIAEVWGPDAAYWATPARLGEILVGALLAMALRTVGLSPRVSMLAPAALVMLTIAVVTFPSSSGPAYQGLLPILSLVSGALILGLQVDGPSRRLLSSAPLVALGKISYGLYLVHWPVFVVVDAERVGIDGIVLTALRLSITVAIALASYHLLEQPIRMRQRVPFRVTVGAAALSTIALTVVALVMFPSGQPTYWRSDPITVAAAAIDPDQARVALTQPTAPPPTDDSTTTTMLTGDAVGPASTTAAASTTSTTIVALPQLARPVRIVVTGDSTSDALGTGVVGWAAANPELAQVEVEAALGCGFLMGGDRLIGDEFVSTSSCDGWPRLKLIPRVGRTTPDVVAVMTTTWDILDRRWEDGEVLGPEDPRYRNRLVDTYTVLVDDLVASGAARVAFIRQPVSNSWWRSDFLADDDPSRHAVLRDVYDDVAAARPDTVRVIDLASWFTEAGFDTDTEVRPDGIHLTPEAATMIASRFLGEQLIRAAVL